MKKIPITFILMLALSAVLPAQTREMDIADDDAFFRIAFNQEKRAAIADFLELSEIEANRFWPIYNDYETRRQRIGTGMIDLIEKYVARRESLTDEEADVLMKDWQKYKKALLTLREQFHPKVKKALGSKAAAGWFQMEEFVQTYALIILMKDVPFIEGQHLKEKRKN